VDNFSITQHGEPLDKSKYMIDIESRAFSTNEDNLVLDFHNLRSWTFKTGCDCTFKTGGSCTFDTRDYCTFDTGDYCTFCVGNNSTFNTSEYCNFNTGNYCTFNTLDKCTFSTGGECTFTTGSKCIFSLWRINTCKFKKYDGVSIILDRNNDQRYCLNEDFKNMLKVLRG